MQNLPEEKRRHDRIERPCIIRFRQTKPEVSPVQWDVTTVRDMSKTGILFYSSRYFEPGSELEINLRAPLLTKKSIFWVTVVRCKPTPQIKDYYEIAVSVSKIDEATRGAFDKTIEFFIRKKKKESA